MSEIGHPCHFDPNRRDCAWCNKDGFQCAPNNGLPANNFKEFTEGQYCEYWKNNFKNCGGESKDLNFVFDTLNIIFSKAKTVG